MRNDFSDEQLKQLQEAIVEPLQYYIDKKFAENTQEHREMRTDIQDLQGAVGRNTIAIERLDSERLAIVQRQDRLERMR